MHFDRGWGYSNSCPPNSAKVYSNLRQNLSLSPVLSVQLLMHSGEVQIPVDEREVERGTKNTMTILGSGHWFVWDPCGIVCAVVTYMLIAYGEMVVLLVLFPPFPTFGSAVCVLIFTALATLAVVSHLKAMFTDPVSVCITSIPQPRK